MGSTMETTLVTTASGATWQEVAAGVQSYRNSTMMVVEPHLPVDLAHIKIPLNVTGIPKQILTTREIEITETPVEHLAPLLAKGVLSATEVTNAYLRRAGLAQLLTNCVTELMPKQALARAAFLDAYLVENKRIIGPLHGIPISVKEHVGMKDMDLNAGFVSWVGRLGQEDAHLLQILWNAGAVFYVRTTEPQTLMHLETSSNIYGVTVNPFNTTLTSGGSSGGEGALLGMRGSCLGIGTDIGGSIRSPAANNGVYGFRPTSYRLPLGGISATMLGQEQVVPCVGPLSTSLEGIKLFMRTVVAAKPWLKEPSIMPLEWQEHSAKTSLGAKKLKIGVIWDDGVVKPHPPVTRAITKLVDELRKNDQFEVVEWKPYKHDLAWEIVAGLYFSDGASEELEAMSASSEPLRPLSNFIITDNPYRKTHTVSSLWAATCVREEYRAAYSEVWNATGTMSASGELENMVDVILCPVGPSAAPKLDTARYWGYTSQWNILDYPAAVFPVTKVDEEDSGDIKYEPRNEKDAYNWKLWQEHGAKGYADAPINLQLVGRRYQDEKVLEALETIVQEVGLPFA